MKLPGKKPNSEKKRDKVLLAWIASYAVVLIVPLLFSLAGHLYSEYTLVRTLYRVQEESALQMQSLCDEELGSIRKMGTQISADSRVRGWLESEESGVSFGDARLELKETFDYLRSIMDNDAQITDILLLDNSRGYIVSALSASNAYDSGIFDYMGQFSMARETFWERVRSAGTPWVFFTDSKGQTDLYYLSVIVTDSARTPAGILLIRTDLTGLIPAGEGSSLPLLILNNSQIYHISHRSLRNTEDASSFFETTNHGERLTLDGVRYDGSLRTSGSERKISYFYGTDTGSILRDSRRSIGLYFALVLISVIVGWLLVLHMSRRQYDPLEKLAEYMQKQRISTGPEVRDNIYETIRGEYEDVLTESRRLADRLDSEQEILAGNTLDRLLKGYYRTEASAENALDDYGIVFDKPFFHTMIAAVDDYSAVSREEMPARESDTFDLIRFLVMNIGLENIREVYPDSRAVKTDLFVCFIVNHESESEETFLRKLNEAFRRTSDLLKEKMNLTIVTCCSSCRDSLLDLNVCYGECLSSLGGRGQENGLVPAQEELKEDERASDEKKYRELLLTEDFPEASAAFYSLKDAFPAPGYVFHLLYLTMDTLRGTRWEEPVNTAVKEMFSGSFSETELCENIRKLFVRFASAQSEGSGRSATARAEKIRSHIDLHIFDESLSLTDIAREFDITESYVTRLLRTSYGIHVNTYINGRRIEYVKQLIRTTDLSVQDISEKAGFSSYRTMIRIFRQFENMTPTEYRKTVSQPSP